MYDLELPFQYTIPASGYTVLSVGRGYWGTQWW